MMLFTFSLRQLKRHWWLNSVLLASMVLGAGVLSGLPMVASAIAGDSLNSLLQQATIADRNLAIKGSSDADTLPADVENTLRDLTQETMAVRETIVEARPVIIHAGGDEEDLLPTLMSLHFWSFDRLDERAALIEGRWPETIPAAVDPVLEAVIGVEATGRAGISIGDELVSADESQRVQVVGIVSPIDPGSDVWWGDRQMLPFNMWRRIQFNPDIVENYVSLLLTPDSMSARITTAVNWRLILNPRQITASNAESLRQRITAMQGRMTSQGFTVETKLMSLLDSYQDRLAQARVALLLLTAQSSLALLYLLNILGGFLIERARVELHTMSGRGFNRRQLAAIYALPLGLLAVIAWLVSPRITQQVIRLAAGWRDGAALDLIPAETWWLALGAVTVSWLALVISIYLSIRYELSIGEQQRTLAENIRPGRRRLLLDISLLALGGLTYWQLTQAGSFIKEGETGSAGILGAVDPVLLIGPSLLLMAIGLIFLRLFPYLLKLAAWVGRQTRGLILPLGLTRLVRQPVGTNRVTLLISVTVGLIFFATIFSHSLITWQEEMARYNEGADIRLLLPPSKNKPGSVDLELPDGAVVTRVNRVEATFQLNEYQRFNVDLLAVDPSTFAQVVSFPPGISPFQMSDIMRVLEPDADGPIPVVISDNAITRHLNRGDRVTYELGLDSVDFEVTGIIGDFPLLTEPFAITNRVLLAQRIDQSSPGLIDQVTDEQWISVEEQQHDLLLDQLERHSGTMSLAGDARAKLQEFQADLISRVAVTAFRLNAVVLLILSGVGFVFVQLFTIRQRTAEFGVMRAMGISRRLVWRLLFLEGSILVGAGLAVGAGIGYGLAVVMRPFLSRLLTFSSNGIVIDRIVIDWPTVVWMFFVLCGFYGLAQLLLLMASRSSKDSS